MKTSMLFEPRLNRREILCECLSPMFGIIIADSVTAGIDLLKSERDIGLVISGSEDTGTIATFYLRQKRLQVLSSS